MILLAAGFFWALVVIFTNVTMECETYFAFWTAGFHSHTSLLQAMGAFLLALSAWWMADLVRKKAVRVPVTQRVFQGWLLASMLTVSLLQWGVLFPAGSLAPAANAVIATHNGLFYGSSLYIGEVGWGPIEHWPRADESWIDHPLRWSPFRIYKGTLECVARREFEAGFDKEIWVWPNGITDPG